MRRPGRLIARSVLILLLMLCAFAAFWFGLVPQRFSPLPSLTLDERPQWFIDFRIAALRRDPASCRALLREPHIVANPISDRPIKNGCGWENAFRIRTVDGAELGLGALTCEATAALALWVKYEVQPLAQAMFGARVTSIGDMGTYACRNIIGSRKWANMRSQHALANAVDIGSFRLENGQTISVAKDWKRRGRKARFLRKVHARACHYFRVALSPDYNRAHWNHFHFDRGIFTRCQ
jgi:hypothetical protein